MRRAVTLRKYNENRDMHGNNKPMHVNNKPNDNHSVNVEKTEEKSAESVAIGDMTPIPAAAS